MAPSFDLFNGHSQHILVSVKLYGLGTYGKGLLNLVPSVFSDGFLLR